MGSTALEIHAFDAGYRDWAAELLQEAWGSHRVVSRGQLHDALELPGFVAVLDGLPVGLVTYRLAEDECELVTMNSLRPGKGIGTALLRSVKRNAKEAGCHRLWLITTNDNTEALRFYQLKGFELAAVHHNALAESRRLKPEIPEVGLHGIPLRDELELEYNLGSNR